MQKKIAVILYLVLISAVNCIADWPVELIRYKNEFSTVRVEPAKLGEQRGLAVIFVGTDGLHYYASQETAPAGYHLKVEAESEDFGFGKTIFPQWSVFQDPAGNKVEVYAGRFAVFVPITTVRAPAKAVAVAEVKISGIACTDIVCLPPFEQTLQVKVDWAEADLWPVFTLKTNADVGGVKGVNYPVWFALGLAFLSGLVLNIMPCVLPVIPLKVMSIFEQARESKGRCIAMGLSFCLGILLFFAVLVVLNIVLRLGYGTVFQWGDHFRHPAFIVFMSLLMLVLALFCFGVFTVNVPSSFAGRAGSGKGYTGSVAMGFLAAILSTPCSFAILTAAFAWAQTQKLAMASIAIMMIGVGMAAPYALLTSMPSLLKHLPKPGRWMELFKQTMGFVLLIVAVWLLTVLPAVRRQGVLYFGVILAFCVWMWGGWVDLTTPKTRKLIIRIIALAIAVAAGMWLLPAPKSEGIDWHNYDAALVETARQHRPVLVEFMADWCLTCKAVEKTVYARSDITELIKRKNVLAIKANTTLADSPATIALKDIYNEPGVPVTMLFIPDQTEPVRLHGLIIGEKLKQLLEQLPDKN